MLPPKAPKIAPAATAAPLEGRDNITNLPDGVLQHILSFLPAQDAVRTCVLAKRWRHLWESTTSLRFVCGERMQPDALEKIQKFVDHLLRLRIRGGTPLDTCEFRLGETTHEDDMSRIMHWIRIALQCKVRVLQLMCWGIPRVDDHPIFISQYLKMVQLTRLSDYVTPSRLLDFSCCPNLEDLEIVECELMDVVLISSQSLKHLTIQDCSFAYDRHIPICAPNLVSLWLDVFDGRIPSLQSMPSLLEAFVKTSSCCVTYPVDDDDDEDNQSILLQGVSDVRNLALVSSFAKKPAPVSHSAVFFSQNNQPASRTVPASRTRVLLLNEDWCEPPDFSALACLLKLSPVLEKLTLQLYSEGPEHKVEIKLSCKPLMSAAISQHLKTLEVKCEVYDKRINNVLTFLSKQLNIWFQFGG